MHLVPGRAAKLLWLAFFMLACAGPATAKRRAIGEPAPDAVLTLLDGTKLHLSDMRGQVVVLNFWATWCVPCRKELPLLDSYYNLQKQHGLRVYAVTTEGSVPNSQLKPLFKLLTIQPVRSIGGGYAPIGDAVPSNFIIDRAGKLRYARAGAFTLDELNAQLVPLLNEKPPAEAQGTGAQGGPLSSSALPSGSSR